jgi:hypothetical protein
MGNTAPSHDEAGAVGRSIRYSTFLGNPPRRPEAEAHHRAAENRRLVLTIRLIAHTALLCAISLAAPGTIASAQAEDPSTAKPCPIDLQATRVAGDPNAATIRTRSIPAHDGTIVAYGAVTRWSAPIDRYATAPLRYDGQNEYSFVVRAPGRIEAVLYEPPGGGCLAHAVVRERNGYDGPDLERPLLVLSNAQPLEPINCATRYAAATTIEAARPEMPPSAPVLGVEGTVYVLVTIDARGQPINAKVMSSPGSILNTPSVEAAMHSIFSPEIFRCHSVPGTYVFGVMYG